MSEEALLVQFGNDRIASRQIDELIGISGGLVADCGINHAEVEFLQKWMVANRAVLDQPLTRKLCERVDEILSDGYADALECAELLQTLTTFSRKDFELGEVLKSTTLPLCDPVPILGFAGQSYCFTGTFLYGQRKHCERAVEERGGICGSLSKRTDVLVIGLYATDSWKHSSFGNKILKAVEIRDSGVGISIVSEEHWTEHL